MTNKEKTDVLTNLRKAAVILCDVSLRMQTEWPEAAANVNRYGLDVAITADQLRQEMIA